MLHIDFETWAVKYMLCYLVFQTIRMGPNTLAINPTWPDEGGPMNNTNYSNSSLPIPTNNYVQISSTSSSTGTMGVNTSVVSSNNSSCSRPSGATTAGWSMARLLWRKIYLKYKLLCHFEISTPFFSLLTSIFCGIFIWQNGNVSVCLVSLTNSNGHVVWDEWWFCRSHEIDWIFQTNN